MSLQSPHPSHQPPQGASTEEIALKDMPGQQKKSTDELSIAVPPSDPPPAAADPSKSPPSYYLPNSPNEMFLVYENEKRRMKEGEHEEELEKESGKEASEDAEDHVAALNRRQTRIYRTLVWAQFSMTVFTCIFIMITMVLVAIILVMLQRTIDRADHVIRENPVSQMYMKLKNAVNKINI